MAKLLQENENSTVHIPLCTVCMHTCTLFSKPLCKPTTLKMLHNLPMNMLSRLLLKYQLSHFFTGVSLCITYYCT